MGRAYLVGAGPGDPGLITVRGADLLRRADVVLHDALVSPALLERVAPTAEIVDVGRRAGEARWLNQDRINRMLVDLARRHEVVVRLKGGDPLVFGRGGEEALALFHAGIPFEIVPGVTAGLGALAHAGIPLTHRGLSVSATLVTAHDADDPETEASWGHLAAAGGTLVIYMGGARVQAVTDRLVRLGRAADTPAAVIEGGTLPEQRVVRATLGDLAERVGTLTGPALIVVGAVAALSEQLEWLRRGPLTGRTILLARARAQRSPIARRLRALGASVIEYPRVRAVAGPDAAEVGAAVEDVGAGGAIVFTGAAGVRAFARALAAEGKDARVLAGRTLVGIGRETIDALARERLACDLALRSYHPIHLAAGLRRGVGSLASHRVLLVLDGAGPSALGDALEAAGARVRRLEVAGRAVDERGRRVVERRLETSGLDAVVVPSSSAVEALVHSGLVLPPETVVIAIGPSTAASAQAMGLPPAWIPEGSGVDALVAGIVDRLRSPEGSSDPSRIASLD